MHLTVNDDNGSSDEAELTLKVVASAPLLTTADSDGDGTDEVSLEKALELSSRLNIYAYDAYLIQCSLQTSTALLTLDRGLMLAASKAGVECMEIA